MIWGTDKNLHEMLKNTTDLPKTLERPFLCCFHNLDSKNAELVDVKKDLN